MTAFDYIVIGAGSAGAVVAARLSENPAVRVLLVEAGGSGRHLNVQIPAAFPKQFKTQHDWEFYTEPEPHVNGRTIYHPRGKMLGGCSGQNAMIYIRGNRYDYDSWAKHGAAGWSYDEVLPLFKRSEHNSRGASEYHGASGPMFVEDPRSPNELSQRIVEAMVASGIKRSDDFNGPEQLGAGLYQVTQKRGQRWTTSDGYLRPARRRPNLTVATGTRALRLRIDQGRVTGVDVERAGKRAGKRAGTREFHRAERETVLSAGAFNTPQLLMLSGIGPADHLTERAREVAAAGPLRDLVGTELHPGGQARTRAELEAEVRRSVEHTYHPSCTARIGTESDGVVDAGIRVHGVAGLRIADASVFPRIPHGNTHAPALMVGEKAADLLRPA
jgi:choline dehydrogenase